MFLLYVDERFKIYSRMNWLVFVVEDFTLALFQHVQPMVKV
jgi:hypothetical protein